MAKDYDKAIKYMGKAYSRALRNQMATGESYPEFSYEFQKIASDINKAMSFMDIDDGEEDDDD